MTQTHGTIAITLILLVPCFGCEDPTGSDPSGSSTRTANRSDRIASKETVTVENGNITEGHPKVTEDVEREIYRSLNHRRKMMTSIKQNSGPNRGIQQMQDELNLLTKGFMSRYGLTQAEIDEILERGDANAWK